MKTASNVFSVIGIVATTILAICYTTFPFAFVFWILVGSCWLFALIGILSQSKHIFVGVMMILFVNIFAGIFYLCWREY